MSLSRSEPLQPGRVVDTVAIDPLKHGCEARARVNVPSQSGAPLAQHLGWVRLASRPRPGSGANESETASVVAFVIEVA